MNSHREMPIDIPQYIFYKRWLTPDEAGLYLGLSIHTLYEKVEKGTIPFKRIPKSNLLRFDRLKIDSWIENGED